MYLATATIPRGRPAWPTPAIDTLELSQWDAQKNRLRKDTRNGQAIAVSLDRNAFLHDGDILLWDEKTKQAVICKIDLCEVLIIDLGGLQKLPADQLIERCVQLGHALGNQHWPAIVQNGFVYVPMAVNRLVMNSVMNTHHFKDITFRFAPGSESWISSNLRRPAVCSAERSAPWTAVTPPRVSRRTCTPP